jgi:hypothetical protein
MLPKAISEAVHRRTNNAMADKRTKRKTIQWPTNGQKDKKMVLQNNTQKAKRLVILPPLMTDARRYLAAIRCI